MKTSRKIVFVKYGSFSHVNEQVASFLSREFPRHSIITFDAAKNILASYTVQSLFLRLKTNLRSPFDSLRGLHSPWDFVFRDSTSWKLVSKWMNDNVDPASVDFVFQTQSIFDASLKRVPFFVYTDHTRKAHRHQSGGGFPAPVSAGWGERECCLYLAADTVFTLSDFCRKSVVEDYEVPGDKVLTVSTGINMELPDLGTGENNSRPVILFVGGEWKIKGGPLLVEAFQMVRREVPDAELWMVGSRPPQLGPGMKAFGRVNRQELDKIYREAAILCVPSVLDRASMVALDAAAYALPVVTNPFGAGPERVFDGVTGRVVDPRDTTLLSSVLVNLLRDPELRRRLGRAGRERVEKHFTWESVGTKVSERIRKVLHAKKT